MRVAAVLAGLCLALLPGAVLAQTPVDVELVLAVDVSQSMDRGEHELQRQGYVAALQHPQVLGAIASGIYGRIALTYVEWGATQTVMTPWALVDGAASARGFAAALASEPIRTIHGTSISGALAFAAGEELPAWTRPVFGGVELMQTDPRWCDHLLFYEYFHGDNGAGIGASHQTGWTALIANLLGARGV